MRTPAQLRLVLPTGQSVAIDRELHIGQAESNQIVLRDERVSRRHCRIAPVEGGRVQINDLESTNGTYVDNLRIAQAELSAGSIVSIGRMRMRVAVAVDNADDNAGLIGNSEAMHHVRVRAMRLATRDLPVLIHGETGTGKELIARLVHNASGRTGAFIAVNCGSIARDLIESELFGHERGAFTGAATRRDGFFVEARGGTLFLDEIGELPLEHQARLLRVLETKTVRPVGANREVPVDVRIVAATHVNMREAVATGKFREDLYYRLAVSIVETPPLRLRSEDIPQLAAHILSVESGSARLSTEAMAALCRYGWPGNVRELCNVLRSAVALGGPVIQVGDLNLTGAIGPAAVTSRDAISTAGRSLQDIENEVIRNALRRNKGNRSAAAQELRMPKSTLCDKAKRYGLDESVPPAPADHDA